LVNQINERLFSISLWFEGLPSNEARIQRYKELLEQMPISHRETLLRLLSVLRLIAKHEGTRMTPETLATTVAPVLARVTNPVNIQNYTNLVQNLIENYEHLIVSQEENKDKP
jgi:hypothetical protein